MYLIERCRKEQLERDSQFNQQLTFLNSYYDISSR